MSNEKETILIRIVKLIERLSREITDLHTSEKNSLRIIELLNKKVEEGLNGLETSVSELYESAMIAGKNRIEDCVYSRGGYCEHPAYSMSGRPADGGDTTKIKGRYYPAVSWGMCYPCSKYGVPPEQIASK